MKYTEYKEPGLFLDICRPVFDKHEALYGLMLGIVHRLVKTPLYYGSQPLLATIDNDTELELIALMTPPYKLQIALLNADAFEAIQILASNLHENGWDLPGVLGEEKAVKTFATNWNTITGTSSKDGMRQRIYELQTVQPIQYPEGTIRQASDTDLDLALEWFNCFYDDCFGDTQTGFWDDRIVRTMLEEGNIYFWDDPDPVSIAALTRPTEHGVSISYVYTPPKFRRQGYASAVVARLSQLALNSGKEFCTLYTDLDNPTSNSIYQKIGYNPIADVLDVIFTK